jgi:hypothetical protein
VKATDAVLRYSHTIKPRHALIRLSHIIRVRHHEYRKCQSLFQFQCYIRILTGYPPAAAVSRVLLWIGVMQLLCSGWALASVVQKVVKYLLAHDPVNQPIDYLINSSHVTSNGTCSHYQNKLVLASATCLRALLWLFSPQQLLWAFRCRSVASQHL